MEIKKVWAALAGAASFVWGAMPDNIQRMAIMVSLFMAADFVTGVLAVVMEKRRISSHAMRAKTFSKVAQYAVIGLVSAGVAIFTGHPEWIFYAGFVLCSVELLSITENLNRMEKRGAKLGPLRPFLKRVSQYIEEKEKDDGKGDSEGEHRELRPVEPPAVAGSGEGAADN